MARKFFATEKGLRIYAENSQTSFIDLLFGSGVPGGDTGDQDAAPIGSIYLRTNGSFYQKIANAGSTADWLLNGTSSATIGKWRPELVDVVTNDTVAAGTIDYSAAPFSDDDDGLAASDFTVGHYVIGDADGTPALFEITAVAGNNVTFAAAATALAADDSFLTKYYLPDPAGQEGRAIVVYNGTAIIKIADVDWDFATGINISAGYTAANGSISSADSVESALEKLDGNQQDIQTASGISQGDVSYGTFSGSSLADSQTAKQLFQRIETLLEQMRGVQVAGITSSTAVDSVPVASVKACKWIVEVFEDATPANRQAFEVYAMNDGTNVDDTLYAKLKLGSNFNFSVTVDVSGGNMRLMAASTSAGVTVTARRIEVVKSVL